MKYTVPVDITNTTTEEDLRKLPSGVDEALEKIRALDLGSIHVADKFFQQRDLTANRIEHETHTRELIRTLRDTRKPFAPLVVVNLGGSFYLVDGHYRLTAYRSVGWGRKVPVVVFVGDLDAAWQEALRLNVWSKRPMSLADKLEAAWRMTRREAHTKAQVAAACAIADGTVATMRRRLRELREAGQDPAELTWAQAKHGKPREELAEEDWLDKYASEWAGKLVKLLGSKPRERPDILAAALEKVDAGLPRALMAEWRGELRDLVEQWAEEEAAAPF